MYKRPERYRLSLLVQPNCEYRWAAKKAVLPTAFAGWANQNCLFSFMEQGNKYFIYLRKSTDETDRQIQSIEDQKKELARIAKAYQLKVVGIYQENISAKRPGRSEFNRMLQDIRKGKANGILCWKINRLTRNPIDSGEIQYMLQEGILRSIWTTEREHKTGDNVLMMTVEAGMATQYILDLSKDVQRGLRSKAEKGWCPTRAPIGYKNDKGGDQGSKVIHVDEEKFPLVRKMWDLMLTGEYSVSKIVDIANEELGLRTSSRKRELWISQRHGYKIFSNPFYYGDFLYSGTLYKGQHQPMVTLAEFEKVQVLLGLRVKPQTRHQSLPYRGTMRCGECGCYITTSIKTKLVKSLSKEQSYLYHHCTHRKKELKCSQKPISHGKLNEQITEKLENLSIPMSFLDLTLEIIRRESGFETEVQEKSLKNQKSALTQCEKRIQNLIETYISPENSDRELLTEEELKEQKTLLMKEKTSLEGKLSEMKQSTTNYLELTEETFRFAIYAKHQFITGGYIEKTRILANLGWNCTLKDGELAIGLKKCFRVLADCKKEYQHTNEWLELSTLASDKTKTAPSKAAFELMSG